MKIKLIVMFTYEAFQLCLFMYRKRTQKAKEAEKLELKLREQEKQTGFEGSFLGKTYAGKEEKGCVETIC